MSGIKLIVAVMEDLILFARDAVSGVLPKGRRGKNPLHLPPQKSYEQLGNGESIVAEAAEEEEFEEEPQPLTFRSTAEILEDSGRPEKNTVMYTGKSGTALYHQPTIEFDGVLRVLPYGAMVMVLEGKGRWARIAYREQTGWVLRDELMDRSAYVYPNFEVGRQNGADEPNTVRVRACIEDEFGGGKAELPLQSSEYVLYRLYKKGARIDWPDVRPRLPGAWHEILRGAPGVRITIEPRGGTVMEYMGNEEGHLAYVEAVFPDETISLSEADFPNSGIYNERILKKEEWKELRPVFIEIDV